MTRGQRFSAALGIWIALMFGPAMAGNTWMSLEKIVRLLG